MRFVQEYDGDKTSRKQRNLNEFVSIVQLQREGCNASNYKGHRLKMRLKKAYRQLVLYMPSRHVLGEIFSENISVVNFVEESIC